MPRYFYECDDCLEGFDVYHSINDEWQVCIKCEGNNIRKVPCMPITFSGNKEKDRKTGDLVKEFIEDSRQSLKKEKNEARSEEYK
jgi:putative FmdB family regulatory protein